MDIYVLGTTYLEAHLFGSPEFLRGGELLPLPATHKATSLLAYLLLRKQDSHAREKLATLFWGDVSDEQARHSLRTALAALRKGLGDELLLTDRDTVQITPDISVWVDALAFQEKADSAKHRSIADLQSAIDLYRGDLLADFYDDWVLQEREHYRTLYLDLLLQMTQLMRSRSEYSRAVEYAQKVLESDPANERAHQHLIFCRLASGDRAAALRQYEECRRVLQEELAVEPAPETTALYQWLKQAPVRALEARITNLPIPLTSFIGRAREMARVKELLAQARLVTLTGSGGCGKTRLAIQVASDLVDSFRDGVWWVDFAPLMDETLIPQTVAKAAGIYEMPNIPVSETLAASLCSRNTLLVLDNCEHLVGGVAALVMILLNACPQLKILTTSREALNLAGEMILRMPSLSFPMQPQLLPGESLADYESVRLLTERAAAVRADFDLNAGNASAVVQICQRLDGIPLALELAAARIKVLPVQQIAARLDDCFGLLTAGSRVALPRHQTLRAVIDWSVNLLAETERILLFRLSVFVSGWTLEAAQAVCSDAIPSAEALDLISQLVDKSLMEVTHEPEGKVRYRMLETMRQYGLERLAEAGQEQQAKRQHALFFTGLAEKMEQQLRGREMQAWLDLLDREHDNFHAALEWSLANEMPRSVLHLASALGIHWRRHGDLSEGQVWMERLLALIQGVPPQLRVRVMAQASWLARDLGDYRRAVTLQRESLAILRAADDKWAVADLLIHGGLLAIFQNDLQQARACYEECLALSDELGYRRGRGMALMGLANVALFDLKWDAQARSRCEESLEIFKEVGDGSMHAEALMLLGAGAHYEHDDQRARMLLEQAVPISYQSRDRAQLAWTTAALSLMIRRSGGPDEALPVAKEALRLAVEMGDKTTEVFALAFLGLLAKDRGQIEQAIHLLGFSIAYGESFGCRASPFLWDTVNPDLDIMRSLVGKEAFQQAWTEGGSLSLGHAIQEGLQV